MSKYERVSRWIKIRSKQVTEKSSLYPFSDKETGEVQYFTHDGHEFALGQFVRKNTVWFSGKDVPKHIVAMDALPLHPYNAYFLEIDSIGENVRLYVQKTCQEEQ